MLKTLFISVLVILLIVAVATYLLATHVLPYAILQPGHKTSDQTPAAFGLPYEHFQFRVTDSIELDALFVPATTEVPRANLMMLHGVGSCKEVYLGSVAVLVKMGYNVMLWDQRAHGKSGGKFLTYGYFEKHDVSKAIDWLEARNPGLPTGIYGNSMGGAVALQSLAHDDRLKFGLIESTFTDLASVSNAYGQRMGGIPLPWWLTNYVVRRAGEIADFEPFTVRPIDAAKEITQPVQLIHGNADRNINISNAHALFEALASNEKDFYIVEGGDHADLWAVGKEPYQEALFGFFRRMVEGENEGVRE